VCCSFAVLAEYIYKWIRIYLWIRLNNKLFAWFVGGYVLYKQRSFNVIIIFWNSKCEQDCEQPSKIDDVLELVKLITVVSNINVIFVISVFERALTNTILDGDLSTLKCRWINDTWCHIPCILKWWWRILVRHNQYHYNVAINQPNHKLMYAIRPTSAMCWQTTFRYAHSLMGTLSLNKAVWCKVSINASSNLNYMHAISINKFYFMHNRSSLVHHLSELNS
jgi:hypothetical protein